MIKRVPTGIVGFDELAEGGLPEGSVAVVSGPSGSAKTLFCLHFAYHGAAHCGEPAVYISMEESKKSLRETLRGFGMPPEELEAKGALTLMDLGEIRKLGSEEFIDLEGIQTLLDNVISANGVKRVVIDSIAVIGLRSSNIDEFRRSLFQLGKFLQEKDVTSVLITESVRDDLTRFGIEQFIADSFIFLGLERMKGELVRTVLIRKMRLTSHDISVHPFLITGRGIRVSSDVKVI